MLALTSADLSVLVGYNLGAFLIGYSLSWAFYVFRRLAWFTITQ